MLQVIASLGADVTHEGSTVTVDPTGIPDFRKFWNPSSLRKLLPFYLRAHFWLDTALSLAPRGDVIGRRRLNTHFPVFRIWEHDLK